MSIVTRVAPSPTGDPHLGTAFVALMNYHYTRKHGGKFILRIEDTDRARSRTESEEMILESLRWLGMEWDEGPDVGGPNGPYRQSERKEHYDKYIGQLVDQGHAFPCFCSTERLNLLRESQRKQGQAPRYDGRCARRDPAEVKELLDKGEPHVIRLKVPEEGNCVFEDGLRGEITIAWETVDMQVLQKSDGMPTYHAANVIDDHLMGVNTVIRGEEWIPSTPKHLLLYQYFGWQPPSFLHLPLLRNLDRSKLSKRKNPTSINYYRRMGYLPEALASFLVSLAPGESFDEEKLTDTSLLTENFDLQGLSLGGPVFDVKKLDWLNGRFMRDALSPEEFTRTVYNWVGQERFEAMLAMAQSRVVKLSDLGDLMPFLFAGELEYTEDQLLDGQLDKDALMRAIFYVSLGIEEIDTWSAEACEAMLRRAAEVEDVKFGQLVRHLYIVITGKPKSLPLFQSMELLGRDLCRARVRNALAALGGIGKKKGDELAKNWTAPTPEA